MTMLRVCSAPGCVRTIPVTSRRCALHAKAEAKRRNRKPRMKVYASSKWRGPNGTRRQVLERDDRTCVTCGATATHVDHIVPLTHCAAHGIDPFDPDNCRALCARHAGMADGHRAYERKPSSAPPPRPPDDGPQILLA